MQTDIFKTYKGKKKGFSTHLAEAKEMCTSGERQCSDINMQRGRAGTLPHSWHT